MSKKNIVITGGAGFIGSHVVRLFVNKYPEYKIINLDKLTYAGNLANLKDIEGKPNYKFVKMDICDFDAFYKLMQDEKIDGIIHLAAESHVDRSIKDPFTFAQTIEFAARMAVFAANSVPNSRFAALKAIFAAK